MSWIVYGDRPQAASRRRLGIIRPLPPIRVRADNTLKLGNIGWGGFVHFESSIRFQTLFNDIDPRWVGRAVDHPNNTPINCQMRLSIFEGLLHFNVSGRSEEHTSELQSRGLISY